ncbi:MAG: DUF6514 family protein [Bacillota bacterium]|nr:DUF6514 family protein [Bacillota bacterium]
MKVLEELITTKREDQLVYTYCYRLTCDDFSIRSGEKAIKFKAYGIEAERKDFQGTSIENIERNSIPNISPYRHKVKALLNIIYKNNVSPIHLVDILGNYVDECACDYQENIIEKSV